MRVLKEGCIAWGILKSNNLIQIKNLYKNKRILTEDISKNDTLIKEFNIRSTNDLYANKRI